MLLSIKIFIFFFIVVVIIIIIIIISESSITTKQRKQGKEFHKELKNLAEDKHEPPAQPTVYNLTIKTKNSL